MEELWPKNSEALAISVYDTTGNRFPIVAIYAEDGMLCIDIDSKNTITYQDDE